MRDRGRDSREGGLDGEKRINHRRRRGSGESYTRREHSTRTRRGHYFDFESDIRRTFKRVAKIRAPCKKKVLEFAQEVMGMFTAEDLESNNEMVLSKVRLVLQEEFDKDEEIGVTREALEKYLGDVLPVMDMQDERLKEQLAACEDPKVQVQMVAQMMQRTKERMQIDHLREVARTFRSEE